METPVLKERLAFAQFPRMFRGACYPINLETHTLLAAGLEQIERRLLPPLCLLCGAPGNGGRDLCAACAAELPRNQPACSICAASLPPGQTGSCTRCRAHPPDYDRSFAPFRYQHPTDFLICELKFKSRLDHARLLGELFAAALAERGGPWPDGIVPVPLHPARLRERGFNQALELARAAARRWRIPLWADGLRRVRHTPQQSRLGVRARQTNLLGAFAPGGRALSGARVALFDDVMTTASTIAECARILRASGAAEIDVWIISRAGHASDSSDAPRQPLNTFCSPVAEIT